MLHGRASLKQIQPTSPSIWSPESMQPWISELTLAAILLAVVLICGRA
jgi:hypothetical protein